MDFEYDYLFKIVFVGDAGVGKTSLVKRFSQDNFLPGEGPTIGVDFAIKTIEAGGKTVKVGLLKRTVHRSLTKGIPLLHANCNVYRLSVTSVGHCRSGAFPHYHAELLQKRSRHCRCLRRNKPIVIRTRYLLVRRGGTLQWT